MWPKNLTVLGIKTQGPLDLSNLPIFQPVGDLQIESFGFAPVRDDQLAYTLAGQTLLKFTHEKKHLPPSAVAVALDARCAELEHEQGFPPGKKVRKELKERVVDELLPRALATRRTTLVWIDHKKQRLMLDSTSNSVVEQILRTLLKSIGLSAHDSTWPSRNVMTDWLAREAPDDFTIDDQVALRWPGAKGKVVKYSSAQLTGPDVAGQLATGATAETIAMTYESRISFVLTDNSQLRRIRPLDILKDSMKQAKDVDRFDNDVYLMTAELGQLIDAVGGAA